MTRIEPPSLATWMLEHLTPGDRDEALAGDLLEQFQSGRSGAWYWRQALHACVVGWTLNLRARLPLLVFALLWSMLAPAWTAILDRILNDVRVAGLMWHMDAPFSPLWRLLLWMPLNVLYLWAGILLFVLSHGSLTRAVPRRQLFTALGVAAGLFLPVYFGTFVVANLLAWPGPVVPRHSLTPVNELADLAVWADILRIPYFLTLLFALWKASPRYRRLATSALPLSSDMTDEALSIPAETRSFDPFTLKRFFGFVVSAGLINAMLVSFLLCRLPDPHSTSGIAVLLRALLFVGAGALAGVGGAWLYWNNPASPFRSAPPLPFPLFALACASGWVWVPAMSIYSEQLSAATTLAACCGALALASGLRIATAAVFAPVTSHVDPGERLPLFAETLYRAPGEPYGAVIALCLYDAGAALALRALLTAATLLSSAAFLFAWKRAQPLPKPARRLYRGAALRLACVTLPAVLFTAWALLDGYSLHHRGQDAGALLPGTVHGDQKSSGHAAGPSYDWGGYHSIILWPVPPKKEIVAPVPLQAALLAPGVTHAVSIPFDGAYWYLQPPNTEPGPHAHKAFGSPLALDIRSNNSLPLIMQAHQHLAAPVPLDRCRTIQVDFSSRDTQPGPLGMAVLLSDSFEPERGSVYLGQQPVTPARETSAPGNPPAHQSLQFAIPVHASIRRFNEIKVLLLPDWSRAHDGPRLALEQFQLYPR